MNLMLLLASWTGIRATGFVLNRKLCVSFQARNLPLVSLKFLTSTENNFDQKMKVRLLLIVPKTVIIHAMFSTFSAAMFSAVSTASYTVGAWQKQVLCFCVASGKLRTDGKSPD